MWETQVLSASAHSPAEATASTVQKMTVEESRMKRMSEPMAGMVMHGP